MRGADFLVQTLANAGVTQIFALSGNQIMPIFDACLDAGIKIIHTRHEAAAVFMAEAWSQITNQPSVALVTAGGGIANALGPIFTSAHSQTPVLVLSGDSPAAQDGRGAFQEMDQVALTASLTKYSARPKTIQELKSTLEHALSVCRQGNPGPVHLALPDDLLRAETDDIAVGKETVGIGNNEIEQGQLQQFVELIANADRPLVIAGPSLNDTRCPGLVQRLETTLQVPVIVMESPRGLNDPSLGAIRSLFCEADLFVSLGKPIDFSTGFGVQNASQSQSPSQAQLQARWAIVNASEEELDRALKNLGERLAVKICSAPMDFISRILEEAASEDALKADRRQWIETVKQAVQKRAFNVEVELNSSPINSMQLCSTVQHAIAKIDDSIVICDGGEFGQWAQAIVRGNRRIINGVSGAIGGGICYAIGAKCASPASTVIALMGDGSAGFHFLEFETAVRENIPFVAIIGNDQRWNAEHQIQLRDYGAERLNNCQLSDARYDQLAIALGGHGEYVTSLSDLNAAINRAIASRKPACINVMIEGLPAPASP